MSQRHAHLNVNEPARLTSQAVGEKLCITYLGSIEKYADGMDNGTQVVAKGPNPNAGRPHFTPASEVATMDFSKNDVQIPQLTYHRHGMFWELLLFAWSSKAQENPVGAEYIIMEKFPGIELERVWPSITNEYKGRL